jgi:4-hydroxybenzoyl-CoA thioesterase
MTVEHTTTLPVRWGDVDAAGIVFYPRFYEWYDLGCESLFAALGLPWPELFPRHGIVGVPIVEAGSRFTSPARYGDTLHIHATGFEVRAWVKRPSSPAGRLQAVAIPEVVARRLRGDAGGAASP